MTADQPVDRPADRSDDNSVDLPGAGSARTAADPAAGPGERQPDWWHRDHPTFTALTGFLTGLAFVILVPGVFVAVLYWLFEDHTAEDLFPFVLVTLAVPLGLVAAPRTRRFGRYMLIGLVTTLLVVAGVAGLVLWYMVTYQS